MKAQIVKVETRDIGIDGDWKAVEIEFDDYSTYRFLHNAQTKSCKRTHSELICAANRVDDVLFAEVKAIAKTVGEDGNTLFKFSAKPQAGSKMATSDKQHRAFRDDEERATDDWNRMVHQDATRKPQYVNQFGSAHGLEG